MNPIYKPSWAPDRFSTAGVKRLGQAPRKMLHHLTLLVNRFIIWRLIFVSTSATWGQVHLSPLPRYEYDIVIRRDRDERE